MSPFSDPMALDSDGTNPECSHPHIERTHLHGSGTHAVYLWTCPDCAYRETEGFEG